MSVGVVLCDLKKIFPPVLIDIFQKLKCSKMIDIFVIGMKVNRYLESLITKSCLMCFVFVGRGA